MPSPADAIAARLDPVDLDEVRARASLEQRTDTKYVVGWGTVVDLVDALAPTHAVLEIGDRRQFGYRTVYYDTATFATYRAHVQGRRRRFKARVREYTDTGYSRTEVKLKGRRGETVKRWTDEPADVQAFVAAMVGREYGIEVEPLAPVVVTHYRRITLAARESAERVTIDYDLRFGDAAGATAALRPDLAIVEGKSTRGRGAAEDAMRRLRVRPDRVSKYIAGLALLIGEAPNDARRLLRTSFAS